MKIRLPKHTFHAAWAVAIAAVATLLASPAAADWRRADSPRFIVYSDGSERLLREYVGKLETFDYFLRSRFNLPQVAPARRLPIYLLGNASGLERVRPNIGDDIAGFYVPTGEDIFAVALRARDDDYLLHEYFHHFSFQVGAASGYPGWLVEGLAEYYMTAEIEDGTVTVGNFNTDRAMGLAGSRWIALEDLVAKLPSEARSDRDWYTYYPVAWLLTHWFLSDETRAAQLRAYVVDVQSGTDSVVAMEKATGLTMTQLLQALRAYTRGSLASFRFEVDAPEPEITVTRLPRSADDLLLIGQRLKAGTPEDEREETAALVRRLAARHPDDPFARLQLGHAELHFGDPVAGEAVLTQLLEQYPDNVEALQLMATRRTREAIERPDEAETLLRRARAFLAQAYQVDSDNYYTLYLLARSREQAANYPNDNDISTWHQAFVLAPQLSGIRLGYAAALMSRGEFKTAEIILTPLAGGAHGGAAIAAAQALIQQARNGQAPISTEAIDAATEADEENPPEPGPATVGEDGSLDEAAAPAA